MATMSLAVRNGQKAWVEFQKRSMASSERDEHRRSAFAEYVRRFVFVDECSTNIALSPIYARAPKGERASGKAPRNWGKNVSLEERLACVRDRRRRCEAVDERGGSGER